jgi:hypothetical protein
MQDLIYQLTALRGEACEPSPEAWYAATFGEAPEYSRILEHLSKSPAERSQLLRRYFEPTEDEREAGQKIPTPAHRAIAQLMAQGYVRAAITTNFDRLLEVALADAGVQPTVISSADALQGHSCPKQVLAL